MPPKVYGPEDFSSLFNPFASKLSTPQRKAKALQRRAELSQELRRSRSASKVSALPGGFYSVPKRAHLHQSGAENQEAMAETYQKKVRKQEPSAEDIAAHVYSVKMKTLSCCWAGNGWRSTGRSEPVSS